MAILGPASLTAAAEPGFKVVVNGANPLDSLPRAQVSRLFLKADTTWPGGQKASPVDLSQSSDVRASFSQAIHGRAVSAITWYWQKLIFSGVTVPPVEMASEVAVLAFVRANAGAVGYVSAGASVPPGVKVLQITD